MGALRQRRQGLPARPLPALEQADWVATITPSAYLQRFAEPEPLGEVFPASWFQPNFATWFGEEEEALAWDYLWRVRDDLRRAERSGEVEDEAFASAYERMLFAEGSDWFWWYGSDQESGDDGFFDRAFRELLGQVYDRLGRERPPFLQVPIIPSAPVPVSASRTRRRRSRSMGISASGRRRRAQVWRSASRPRAFGSLSIRRTCTWRSTARPPARRWTCTCRARARPSD